MLKDLSMNGTFVDGVRVGQGQTRLVNNGSEIQLLRTKDDKISYIIYLTPQTSSEQKLSEGKFLFTILFCLARCITHTLSYAANLPACLVASMPTIANRRS